MKKDILLFNSYMSVHYNLLQMEIAKVYSLDMDIFHDCIIDLYSDLLTGLKYKKCSVKEYILIRYRKSRNKEITKNFIEKAKEDNTLEFINNKTDSNISYSGSKNIRDKAKLLLSKNDFLLLDLYYFQNKPKRIISVFTGISINEISIRLECIIDKLSKKIDYENH